MEKDLADALRKSMLFRNMSNSEISSLFRSIDYQMRTFSKKEVILRDGELQSQLGVVLSGQAYASHIDSNGNSNLMEVIGPGGNIGVLSAVGKYRLHVTVTARKETKVLFLSVDKLLGENASIPPVQVRFLQNLIFALTQKAQRLTRKLEDSVRRTTREKLQDYLSDQYHTAHSRSFVIPLNRQELADYLFVNRSSMSSELCRMRDEGLLKFNGSQFELLLGMPITEQEADPYECRR